MEFRSLQTFIQVAEMNSFTRAGEQLGYSQPTISFQIKQLENEFGAPLFERIGHTISLTDVGRDALEYAQKICRMAEEMVQGADKRRSASGVIRIAMADSLCEPLIIRGFSRFQENYPNISLRVTTAGTGELFRLLDHNEADLVCTLDSHIYDANYVIANEEKIGVHFVAASDHPLCAKDQVGIHDLVNQPFLLTEKGMSYRRLMDEMLARHNIEILPVLEFGRSELICSLVEKGVGISFLPDYVTEEAVQANRITRIAVEGINAELWKQTLYHRGKWMSLPLQAIINHLSCIHLCTSR